MQSVITLSLAVLNDFIRKRFTAKSRERVLDCVKQPAFDPHIRFRSDKLQQIAKLFLQRHFRRILPKRRSTSDIVSAFRIIHGTFEST